MSAGAFVRRRWPWLLAGLVAAGVVAWPLLVRARGIRRWEAAKARLEADGLGGGAAALQRLAPPADPEIQARWRQLVDAACRCNLMKTPPAFWSTKDWMISGGPEPEGARAVYDADAAIRAEAAALFAEGTPVAGVLGNWLAAGGGPVRDPVAYRCENLIGVQYLCNVLTVQAAFEKDPSEALASLEGVERTFARPGAIIDAIIGNVAADLRDQACVRLAAGGRLPPDAAARWLAEEPLYVDRIVLALRGERVFFIEPLAEGVLAGRIPLDALSGTSMNPLLPGVGARLDLPRSEDFQWWLHGAEAFAISLDRNHGTEKVLASGSPYVEPGENGSAAEELASKFGGRFASVAYSVRMARQRHRMARALVRALRGDPATSVPGGPEDFPLKITRGPAGRVRAALDLDAPRPARWTAEQVPSRDENQGGTMPLDWRQTYLEVAPLPPVERK